MDLRALLQYACTYHTATHGFVSELHSRGDTITNLKSLRSLGCRTLREYLLEYNIIDVLLLADAFQKFC